MSGRVVLLLVLGLLALLAVSPVAVAKVASGSVDVVLTVLPDGSVLVDCSGSLTASEGGREVSATASVEGRVRVLGADEMESDANITATATAMMPMVPPGPGMPSAVIQEYEVKVHYREESTRSEGSIELTGEIRNASEAVGNVTMEVDVTREDAKRVVDFSLDVYVDEELIPSDEVFKIQTAVAALNPNLVNMYLGKANITSLRFTDLSGNMTLVDDMYRIVVDGAVEVSNTTKLMEELRELSKARMPPEAVPGFEMSPVSAQDIYEYVESLVREGDVKVEASMSQVTLSLVDHAHIKGDIDAIYANWYKGLLESLKDSEAPEALVSALSKLELAPSDTDVEITMQATGATATIDFNVKGLRVKHAEKTGLEGAKEVVVLVGKGLRAFNKRTGVPVTLTVKGGEKDRVKVKVELGPGAPTPATSRDGEYTWTESEDFEKLDALSYTAESPPAGVSTETLVAVGVAIAVAAVAAIAVVLRRRG